VTAAPAPVDAATAARRLLEARKGARRIGWRDVLVADAAAAWDVQARTLGALGGAGGWKVGAPAPGAEPGAAPLPASGLHRTGASLIGPPWELRGVEVEVALRLGRDLGAEAAALPLSGLQACFDAVLPVIEVVETRLTDWRDSAPLAQAADLHNHGALVLGAPAPLAPAQLDLRTVIAYLAFDGQPVASARGANPAGDVWRLLRWLAVHAAARGLPLRAGQVVTTGSCSGLLFAPTGARVEADLKGIGRVALQF
jgi:hypothetical protein